MIAAKCHPERTIGVWPDWLDGRESWSICWSAVQCFRRVIDDAAIELADLAQEGCLQCLRRLEMYDRTMPFGPWATTVARRKAKKVLWQRRQDREKSGNTTRQEPWHDGLGFMMRHAIGPQEFMWIVGRDAYEAIKLELTWMQRLAIRLHYWHGMSHSEIGRTLGYSSEASRRWINKAIESARSLR